ncbi:DUF4192 family protein [Microbacterium sp. CJ88]|uniref:DUF4192 family protein n=1 Tax=Microbacterium sp. CJ88 TaxID=3445672 RepID=UPI003F65C60F
MTTIVKAADAAQFLSLVPQLVGFLPRRSVVLVPFTRSRSVGALRFDLPGPEVDADRIAATLIGTVCRIDHVDAAAIVVYTDEAVADASAPDVRLVTALELRAEECGLRVTDALYVGVDAWGRYLDADGTCTDRPLAEIAGEGDDLADQASGADLPDVAPRERETVARALTAVAEAVRLVCGPEAEASAPAEGAGRVDPSALSAMCELDDLPTLFEEALEWDASAPAPFDAALILWCLSRPSLRDIALVQWCGDLGDGDLALDAQLKWESGEEYPSQLAMRMWGEGPVPDATRLSAALALVRRVAASAPRHRRSGPLATCAWLAWALGRSTHADVYAAQALEIEPEHGLAEIVRSFVLAGHLPDWAFRAAAG